jgi:hypothetical protein
MGGLFDLIGNLFSNVFGFIIIIGIIQWIYRTFINNQRGGRQRGGLQQRGGERRERGNNTLLRPLRSIFNEYDMGSSAVDTEQNIKAVRTSDSDYSSFTERDMYLNVVDENMTYSLGSVEKYENPKELYNVGLITYREFIEMTSNRNRGGN